MAVFGVLLFLPLLEIVIGGDIDILNPSKRCIATATQIGNCHVCMCKTDGVFHCRGIRCDMHVSNITVPSLPECDAGSTYRMDTVFCTCDDTGHWRAERCRRRLYQIRPRTRSFVLRIGTNIECTPEHFYVSECNICVCDSSGYINFQSCTNRPCPVKSKEDSCNPGDVIKTDKELCACSDTNNFIDKLCLELSDEPIQEVDAKALDSIIDFGSWWNDLRVKCKPYYTYNIDCSRCYCDYEGNLYSCEYKECINPVVNATSLRIGKSTGHFISLPVLKSLDVKCKPGVKYRYRCNTCYCNNEHIPICTSMICLKDLKLSIQDLRNRQVKRGTQLVM